MPLITCEIWNPVDFVYRMDKILTGTNRDVLARAREDPEEMESVVRERLEGFDGEELQDFERDFDDCVAKIRQGMQNLTDDSPPESYQRLWTGGIHSIKGYCQVLGLATVVPACETFRKLERRPGPWLERYRTLEARIEAAQKILTWVFADKRRCMSASSTSTSGESTSESASGTSASGANRTTHREIVGALPLRRRVAVVDDSRSMRRINSRIVQSVFSNPIVEAFESGEDFLKRFESDLAMLRGEARPFDMVLLDNCFDDEGKLKTGIEILRHLRQRDRYDGLVTMVSGEVEPGIHSRENLNEAPAGARRFLEAGADFAASKKGTVVKDLLVRLFHEPCH